MLAAPYIARSRKIMGVWLDILRSGAEGDARTARRLLRHDLPLLLLVPQSEGAPLSSGPLQRAARAFIGKLSEPDRSAARHHENEFIDYVVDDVIAGVEKTLELLELCHARPSVSLEQLAESFDWEANLKRSPEWKRTRVADLLRSMQAAGIRLPEAIGNLVQAEGTVRFKFNELDFAVSPNRFDKSWINFKRLQKLSTQFVGIVEDDASEETYAEAMSYGAVTAADLTLRTMIHVDIELELDMLKFGEELSAELASMLTKLHSEKPKDGYQIVAWHNVFWDVHSEYPRLRLTLEMRDPLCETDEDLRRFIVEHHPEVVGTGRVTILRRRQKLHGDCTERISRYLWERLG